MSSIALPFEKQIRNFYIVESLSEITDIEEFASDASAGEVMILSSKGDTVEAGVPFTFYIKDLSGKVIKTDVVDPKKINYLRDVAPQAKVGRSEIFTFNAVTVGKSYTANLRIHFGLSEVNFGTIYASVIAVTGDTTTTIAEKLAIQLAQNLASDMKTSSSSTSTTTIAGTDVKVNKYFTVSVSGAVITITEKDWILENYIPGLRAFDQLLWNVEIGSDYFEADAQVTKTESAGTFPKGQGYQVVELERYLVGHRAEFPGKDITVSFNRAYQADVNETYSMLDLGYFETPRYDPQHSDKGITFASTDAAVIAGILEAIETAQGSASGE